MKLGVLGVIVLTFTGLFSCTARRVSGAQCAYNSECAEGLVCAGSSCRDACRQDRDCPTAGWRCSSSGQAGRTVCVPPDSPQLCLYNSDCPGMTICALDRVCRPQCRADRDCNAAGVTCQLPEGVCSEPVRVGPVTDGGVDVSDVTVADTTDVDAAIDTVVSDVLMDSPNREVECPPATPTVCGGTCVSTLTDPSHCGMCGRACAAGQLCSGSSCFCPGGMMLCASGCSTVMTDPRNCGMCGRSCAPGFECNSGMCECPAARTVCGSACVDLRSDPTNCGSCGAACSGTDRCWASMCSSIVPTALWRGRGAGHSCAIVSDGSVRCWGRNSEGQIAQPSVTMSTRPLTVAGLSGASALGFGGDHACTVVGSAGDVWCWGYNNNGQIGDGTTMDRRVPTMVLGLTGVSAVIGAHYMSCALMRDGSVRCWGENAGRVPVPVTGLSDAVQVAGGFNGQMCARTRAGSVRCFGFSMGASSFVTPSAMPVSGATDVALGQSHTCVVLTDSGVRCWGSDNSVGQLGDGTTTRRDESAPSTVSGLTGVRSIASAQGTMCAVMMSGDVRCWGDNAYGLLGDGTAVPFRSTPGPVPGLAGIVEIAGGWGHFCVRASDGRVLCWGYGVDGQLGAGDTRSRSTPTLVVW